MFRAEQYIQQTLAKIEFDKIEKHPNILIAARFWDDDRYQAARVCYKFMRAIDDMIDDRKAEDETISCMEKQALTEKVSDWIECLKGMPNGDPFVNEIIETIYHYKIPLSFFQNFARSMIYDIGNNGFKTFEDFVAYSEGASNGPASVFLHLCCLQRLNGGFHEPVFDISELARPCALFSYIVHIIRDFQKDQNDKLNYFAEDILSQNKLTPSHLKKMATTGEISENFRNVIRFYLSKANQYRKETLEVLQKLKSSIEPQYYLSLEIVFELYLQIFERIDVEKGSFTKEELNPTSSEIRQRIKDLVIS